MAAAPLGATRPLCTSASHQSSLGEGDRGGRRRTGTRALLSAVSGDGAERTTVDPAVAAAHVDRVCLSDAEASAGD